MDEKILIQSKHYNVKKFTIIVSALAVIVSICMLLCCAIDTYTRYSSHYNPEKWNFTFWKCEHAKSHSFKYTKGLYTYNRTIEAEAQTWEEFKEIHPNVMSYIKCESRHGLLEVYDVLASMIPLSAIIIVLIIYMWLYSYSLTVTDKRVYGKQRSEKGSICRLIRFPQSAQVS